MAERCNELTGREWLQNSFSIWRGISKDSDERSLAHPASFPKELCKKVIHTFARSDANVLDPFNGIGSTTAACAEIGCHGVGIDLSSDFCTTAKSRINSGDTQILQGDNIKVLETLPDENFDLCFTSPPYWNVLGQKRTADGKLPEIYSNDVRDLGNISSYEEFLNQLKEVFVAVHRVLKKGAYCIINVMDLRKKSTFYPLHADVATFMQEIGYEWDDLIIWDRQTDYNNMRPLGYPYRFRINKVHEYLLIFVRR